MNFELSIAGLACQWSINFIWAQIGQSVVHFKFNFSLNQARKVSHWPSWSYWYITCLAGPIGLILVQLVYHWSNWFITGPVVYRWFSWFITGPNGLSLVQSVYHWFYWSIAGSIGLSWSNWSIAGPFCLSLVQLFCHLSNWSITGSIGLSLVQVAYQWSSWPISGSTGLSLVEMVLVSCTSLIGQYNFVYFFHQKSQLLFLLGKSGCN